jgi:hypothetical protein
MAPSFNPDSAEISEVILPDGSTASEVIAPDGSTVFSAIPDTSMFQSAIYQYSAELTSANDGDTVDFQEDKQNADASPNNSPKFRTSFNGRKAMEYDTGSGNDYHQKLELNDVSTSAGGYSLAATIYLTSTTEEAVASFGDGKSLWIFGSDVYMRDGNDSDVFGLTPSTGAWATVGFSFDIDNSTVVLHWNNTHSSKLSQGGTFGSDINIGYMPDGGRAQLTGAINDLVISDSIESDSAFDDYYNDRI